jgi:hypothetical protein
MDYLSGMIALQHVQRHHANPRGPVTEYAREREIFRAREAVLRRQARRARLGALATAVRGLLRQPAGRPVRGECP